MSTIEPRRNAATGDMTYRVRFRRGKQQKSLTFATEKQAKSWQVVLDAHGPEKALALLQDSAPTSQRSVSDQVRHHIAHLTGVTAGTRRRYEQVTRNHLGGRFEEINVEHLTRDDVTRWVNEQTAAPKSVRNWHGLLSAALESAVRDDLLAKNVAKGVKLPRADGAHDEMILLEPWEFDEIASLMNPAWSPLAYFLVGTGLRWGEATALQVGDINLMQGTVRVQRAWKETSGAGWELGPPKTKKGRRTAKVTHDALRRIAPLVDMRPSGEWLFLSKRGGPVRGDWWRTDVWSKAVREWDGPAKPRVHDLRHTFASWAIQAGVPLTVLQRQLGHESIQTTSDTYGHLAPSDFDALGAAIDARMAQGRAIEGAVEPPAIEGHE